MQNKNKLEIAKRAALAYFGFSKGSDKFPKGARIYFYDGSSNNPEHGKDDFSAALNETLKSIWQDEIGSLSKTARLGLHDFVFYVNELRKNYGMNQLSIKVPAERDLLIKLMRSIADLNDSVILVGLTHGKEQKFLLVNTAIAFDKELK